MEKEGGGLPVLSFADGAAFETWLDAHGLSASGLWLKLAKKGAPKPTLSKAEAIDAALCYGWIDGQLDRYDHHHWLVRFTPRKERSKWSEINRTRAAELTAKAGCARPALLRSRLPKRTVAGTARMPLPVRQRRPPTSPPRLR